MILCRAPLVAQVVNNPPANGRDTGDVGSNPQWERSPGGGNGNHCSVLALKILWTQEHDRLRSIELETVDTTEHAPASAFVHFLLKYDCGRQGKQIEVGLVF